MTPLDIDQGGKIPKIMRTPRSVDVDITSQCNLRCRYCYYFDNQEVNYFDLPTEEWLRFFDELGNAAVMDVCIAGGEPFFRADLQELINGIVRNRMRFSILSNGSLIDDDIAEFIATTHRCDSIQISIDGSSSEVHDSCRGKGSFAGAIRGINTLKRYKVPITARVTIHHKNVHDLENVARFLLEELGLSGFSTNSAGALGTCHQNLADVLLTFEDRMKAMKTLLELSKKYKGKISATSGPLAEARNWISMEKARKRGDAAFPNGGHLTGCGCIKSRIAVRSDGVFTPCTMLAHIKLGRINHDSLLDIWQKNSELSRLRNREAIPLESFDFCRSCPYMPYCTGNCPSLAYNLIGQVNHPSPDACLQHFIADKRTYSFIDSLFRSNPKQGFE
jgi:Fe-coproporphyrin III synthase